MGLAQSRDIPARDLLTFPLGLTAEPAALGIQSGAGLWNPATALLPDGARWRLSAAAMNTSDDIGVTAQLGSVTGIWRRTTIGLSVARALVGGLVRTDADPLSIGNEIPYSTFLVSAVLARRISPRLIGGIAIRSRTGQIDNVTRTGASVDVGVVAEHLTSLDVRLGASTFLLEPLGTNRDRASVLLGADARVAGTDTARTVRAGYSLMGTRGLGAEHYLFAAGRWGPFEARGGPLRTEVYGASNTRLRLGVSVYYAGYAIGVAREENASGLAPMYHFSITSVIR
ncbi:MAG TPA: hypothetical protein VHE78_03615 [Gemmatimonadaceae bacterium]|nr:hypothetical protein [Gemmatimonadaceae bacterium]